MPRAVRDYELHQDELLGQTQAAQASGLLLAIDLSWRLYIGEKAVVSEAAPMQQYRHNHYVPVSYQRRFVLPGENRYYHLDLKPESLTSGNVKCTPKALHHWGPYRAFAENDLYTTRWGTEDNAQIEQFFFGQLDDEGAPSIDFIRAFDHGKETNSERLFRQFLRYMSLQKLRTPSRLFMSAVCP
jgi:Protein of unknown function (DUF4238)